MMNFQISRFLRPLGLAVAIAGALLAGQASARTAWTIDGQQTVTDTQPRATGGGGQTLLDRSGATGGGGQHS